MKIKEVCQRTGLTKKAIRYYEDEGLFFPERTTINFREYRDYTETDLEALEQITALRSLSLSIEEIRTMREDPEAAPEIFRKRQEQLQASAEETTRQLRFYQSLDYDRRPFLDYVYARLEEDALWEAPRPREKTAAPAFLVLLPGMAALVVPLGCPWSCPGGSKPSGWFISSPTFWRERPSPMWPSTGRASAGARRQSCLLWPGWSFCCWRRGDICTVIFGAQMSFCWTI